MLTDVMVKYCKMLKPSVKVQEVRLFWNLLLATLLCRLS